jgi:hypothetical protein
MIRTEVGGRERLGTRTTATSLGRNGWQPAGGFRSVAQAVKLFPFRLSSTRVMVSRDWLDFNAGRHTRSQFRAKFTKGACGPKRAHDASRVVKSCTSGPCSLPTAMSRSSGSTDNAVANASKGTRASAPGTFPSMGEPAAELQATIMLASPNQHGKGRFSL